MALFFLISDMKEHYMQKPSRIHFTHGKNVRVKRHQRPDRAKSLYRRQHHIKVSQSRIIEGNPIYKNAGFSPITVIF